MNGMLASHSKHVTELSNLDKLKEAYNDIATRMTNSFDELPRPITNAFKQQELVSKQDAWATRSFPSGAATVVPSGVQQSLPKNSLEISDIEHYDVNHFERTTAPKSHFKANAHDIDTTGSATASNLTADDVKDKNSCLGDCCTSCLDFFF